MADITIQKYNINTGLVPNMAAASAGGDAFLNDGRTILHVKNGHSASQTVTVNAIAKCNHGFDHDLVIPVAAGATAQIGPFPDDRFTDPTTGKVGLTYTGVTLLTVAAVSLGTTI